MVLTESFRIPFGSPAHDFFLKGVDDSFYCLENFSSAKVLVIVFMCNHCPYVQACISRLVALQRDYQSRGVQFVGINSNDDDQYPEDGFPAMKIFVNEHGVNFPYLRDDTQEVARIYQAQCTPDIFVYDLKRRLVYHGRIDDNWKDEKRVTKSELRQTIEAMADFHGGREISPEQFPSMGCSIKWKDS